MASQFESVDEYLAGLPEDRRMAISAVRDVMRANVPAGMEEGIRYNMIGYYVPHSIFPSGYHCDPKQPLPFAHLASQKGHMAAYLFCLYGNPELKAEFMEAYSAASPKKIDMGAGCLRFKTLEEFPLQVLADTLKKMTLDGFVKQYVAMLPPKVLKKMKLDPPAP